MPRHVRLYAEGELHVRQPEGAGRSAVGVDEQRGAVEVEVDRPSACGLSVAQVRPPAGSGLPACWHTCAACRAEVCPVVLPGCAGRQGLFACVW